MINAASTVAHNATFIKLNNLFVFLVVRVTLLWCDDAVGSTGWAVQSAHITVIKINTHLWLTGFPTFMPCKLQPSTPLNHNVFPLCTPPSDISLVMISCDQLNLVHLMWMLGQSQQSALSSMSMHVDGPPGVHRGSEQASALWVNMWSVLQSLSPPAGTVSHLM